MSVEELSSLLPKELIDAAYKMPWGWGDFAWHGNDFKKVLVHLVKIKRMVAGGDIWIVKGDKIDSTADDWWWEADKIDQSEEHCKWLLAAIGEVEKYQALGDEFYFSVDLYPADQGSPKFKK